MSQTYIIWPEQIKVLKGERAEVWKAGNSGNVFSTDIKGNIIDGITATQTYPNGTIFLIPIPKPKNNFKVEFLRKRI